MLQGLISSFYSTAFVTLGAGRIGRDAAVDWMVVGTTYFGKGILRRNPTWKSIAAGLFVHQSADFFWATIFYAPMWPVSKRLSKPLIVIAGVPWAVITAAIELYLILPWVQPWVPMDVPYWTALTVHLASSASYPLFGGVRRVIGGDSPSASDAAWAGGLAASLVGMGALAWRGRTRGEFRLPGLGHADGPDGRFLRHMTAHHVIGLRMTRRIADASPDDRLQQLGELMAAEHDAQIDIMRRWWRSWFGGEMPEISAEEYRFMAGMPPEDLLDQLDHLTGIDLDRLFLPAMLRHHEGALVMCNRVLEHGRDPRNWLLARTIRHSQSGQMEEMRRMLRARSDDGSAAVPFTW